MLVLWLVVCFEEVGWMGGDDGWISNDIMN